MPFTAAILTSLLAVLFAAVSLLMMLVILIQRPKGGGLSGAFGGAGGSAQAAFGAKTGDVLTWVTCVFFVLFLGLAMGLTWTIHAEVKAAKQAIQAPTIGDEQLPPTDSPASLPPPGAAEADSSAVSTTPQTNPATDAAQTSQPPVPVAPDQTTPAPPKPAPSE